MTSTPPAPIPAKNGFSPSNSALDRPRVLVIGPGPVQIGGVTTFIQILSSSLVVAQEYDLIRLDTTREPDDLGLEGRVSLTNLRYFVHQTIQLINIIIKQRPFLMHIPITSRLSFWKATVHMIIGRALGLKVLAHLHGGVFDHYYRQSSKLVQWFIGNSLSQANLIIALSERWKRFLIEEVRPDLLVEVLHNTVDDVFAQAAQQGDIDLDRSDNEVLFVGGLGPRKGVFDILQSVPIVYNAHSNVAFIFAGGESVQGIQAEINRRIEATHIKSVVRFLGPVTGHAKLCMFQKAALFILPSHGENLPYALLEAMSVGLPVVTTPVGAIPEIIKDGQNGFFIQPGDHIALASRILQLLNDKPLRQRMGMANRLMIQKYYLPDLAMTQLVSIYNKLHGFDRSIISNSFSLRGQASSNNSSHVNFTKQ